MEINKGGRINISPPFNNKMKRLFLICSIIIAATSGWAQNSFERKTIHILPNSELALTGKTNITKFGCEFNTACLEETINIEYTRNDNIINFNDAVLLLRNECFDCGNKSINKDFNSLLKTEQFPEIKMELIKINLINKQNGEASVNITIAGKKKNHTVPITIVDFPAYFFTGKLKLDITDFNLEPPKRMLGLIVVKKEIQINFNLAFKE